MLTLQPLPLKNSPLLRSLCCCLVLLPPGPSLVRAATATDVPSVLAKGCSCRSRSRAQPFSAIKSRQQHCSVALPAYAFHDRKTFRSPHQIDVRRRFVAPHPLIHTCPCLLRYDADSVNQPNFNGRFGGDSNYVSCCWLSLSILVSLLIRIPRCRSPMTGALTSTLAKITAISPPSTTDRCVRFEHFVVLAPLCF